MEAAIGCAKRGASVTVYEKADRIGGAAASGAKIPNKAPLQMLVNYYTIMADKLGIDVRLNTEAAAEQIIAQAPYAVFTACGAAARTMPELMPDGERIFTMDEVLSRELKFEGRNVAVIGGGMNACEVAEYCALNGSKVTQVVRRDVLAHDVDPDCLAPVKEHMAEAGGTLLVNHRPLALENGTLLTEDTKDGSRLAVPADVVVLSIGSVPNDRLYQALAGKLERVIPLGDSVKVGRVAEAVRTGFEKSYVLEAE